MIRNKSFINNIISTKHQDLKSKVIYLISAFLATGCEVQVQKAGDDYIISGLPKNCEGINHNESLTFQMYSSPSVPVGQSCESVMLNVVKSCRDGEISVTPTTPTYLSCVVDGTNPQLSCGSIPHGGNIVQNGFSVSEVAYNSGYTCNDRRVSYVSATCNNGVEVPTGNAIPNPFNLSCNDLPDTGGVGGTIDPLQTIKAAKGHSALNNLSTTASFQTQNFSGLEKLNVKIFYARNSDNAAPNTVIAVSDRALVAGQPNSFDQAAVTLRCNSGNFEVRNSGAFESAGISCAFNNAYMIDLVIDGVTKKFDLRIEDKNAVVASKSQVNFRSTYTGATALSSVNVISDRATSDGNTRFDRVTQALVVSNLVTDPLSCGALANGASESRIRFQSELVPEGQTCAQENQSRTCNSGALSSWSGSYQFESCREDRPVAGGMLPAYVKSFGPNGTHWPELFPTPFMYDRDRTRVPHIFEVDANWVSIRNALQSVTKAQADAGVLILVRPANDIPIPANAQYDGSWKISLDNVGSSSWNKRVTIAPRDGYGSVKMRSKLLWLSVHKVALAGFILDDFKCKDCHQSAIAWTKVESYLSVPGRDGKATSNLELTEVVMPNTIVVGDDTADIYSAGGQISNYHVVGSYFAPRYKPTNSNSHTDTLQFATGCQNCDGTSYKNMKLKDSAFFSSTNCSIQTGNIDGLDMDHIFVVAGEYSRRRYRTLSGGVADSGKTFNGKGKNISIKNSIVIGGGGIAKGDSDTPWSSVINTKSSSTSLGSVSSGSSFTVTPNLADITDMPPLPDDNYLDRIWLDPYQ